MEPDIWSRNFIDYIEHAAVRIDDLFIVSKESNTIIDTLINKWNLKLKSAGHASYHLGCDFGRDGDGTLYFALRKCVNKMVDCHNNIFNWKPKLSITSQLKRVTIPR